MRPTGAGAPRIRDSLAPRSFPTYGHERRHQVGLCDYGEYIWWAKWASYGRSGVSQWRRIDDRKGACAENSACGKWRYMVRVNRCGERVASTVHTVVVLRSFIRCARRPDRVHSHYESADIGGGNSHKHVATAVQKRSIIRCCALGPKPVGTPPSNHSAPPPPANVAFSITQSRQIAERRP